jgi:hypothetical protein
LEPEAAQAEVIRLMQVGEDCDQPCFLGITPGETTFFQAEAILGRLGFEGTEISSVRIEEPLLELQLFFTDEVVRTLKASFSLPLNEATPIESSAYTIEALIENYGLPSNVNLWTDFGEFAGYSIEIYYDELDLIVSYYGRDIDYVSGQRWVCPLRSEFSVRIWIGKDPVNPPPAGSLPIEETADMTIQEFADLMSGETAEACFSFTFPVE